MSLERPSYEELEQMVKELKEEDRKRKRVEEQTKQLQEYLQLQFDRMPIGAITWDTKFQVQSWNPAAERIFGFTAKEALGKHAYDLVVPKEAQSQVDDIWRRLLKGDQTAHNTNENITQDGRTIICQWSNTPLREADGTVVGVLSTVQDITERKQAEAKLKASEARFRQLIETMNEGLAVTNKDLLLTFMNERFCAMLGYSHNELIGHRLNEFIHEDFQEVIENQRSTRKKGVTAPYELAWRKKGGEIIYTLVSPRALFGGQGNYQGSLGVLTDITDHKRAEQQMLSLQTQLQQSQKMEAIGQLAGGVAHDFNNLLTVISGQSQLSLRRLRETDPLRESLKEIERAADRAANLTRQLLAFSRRQILEMKVINLNIIVSDLEKMLKRIIGEDLGLTTILADDLGLVKVDPGQIEQVVMNLAVNAKDAMPQGGKLILETANAELDEEYVCSHAGMTPGAYIMFSITDTGTGMTKEVREQIFDPFFTTKEKGKGTGLGLSTVYGIVKQSGGDIYVYSEPNKGTTFKIYLPRVFEPSEELKREAGEELPRGTETVLVVEDDGSVREVAVNILRMQGYKVLEATGGEEALIICEKEKNPIHLILTDILMPHMTGPQLIRQLKQVRQDLKVLYMTGYTDESVVHQGILEKGVKLIHKPFTIKKMARKVREVLDKN